MTNCVRYFMENPEWSLERATAGASGFDLRASIGLQRSIGVGEIWRINTGLYLEMPIGVEAQVRCRSGLAGQGVVVLNSPGTIDADYRGEVKVTLTNFGKVAFVVNPGERIAQLVFAPVFAKYPDDPDGTMYARTSTQSLVRVASRNELSNTARGSGGHGSTGR